MELDDLILISVDDHIIEPPDLFADHLAGQVPGPGTEARAQRGGQRRVDLRRGRHGDGRAQRRRRTPEGGVRHGAAEPRRGPARLLRRARAGEGHGCRRRAGVDELPVVPDLHRPHASPATTPTCRSRSCGRTTTGTSTRGAAPIRGGSSRWPSRSSGTSSRPRPRSGDAPTKGCHSLSFTENPAALGYPSFHDEYWDPVWTGVLRHGHRAVDPPRLVGPAVDPGRRLARRT